MILKNLSLPVILSLKLFSNLHLTYSHFPFSCTSTIWHLCLQKFKITEKQKERQKPLTERITLKILWKCSERYIYLGFYMHGPITGILNWKFPISMKTYTSSLKKVISKNSLRKLQLFLRRKNIEFFWKCIPWVFYNWPPDNNFIFWTLRLLTV